MVSLLLKSLMFVLVISYVCSAVIPQSLSNTRLPENTIKSSEDQTDLTSPIHIGPSCPNPKDEPINRVKKSCVVECQNFQGTKIYTPCMEACLKQS